MLKARPVLKVHVGRDPSGAVVNYGKSDTYRGSGGYHEDTRECITTNADKNHDCEDCGVELECLNDYIVGGSHYWTLVCPVCESVYYFDTYRFELSRRQDVVALGTDLGLSSVKDFAKLAELGEP